MRAFAEVCGAAAVLVAFIAAQINIIAPRTRSYLCLNLAGSGILAVIALSLRQWGFLALEGAWALVSAFTLARTLVRRLAHLSLPRWMRVRVRRERSDVRGRAHEEGRDSVAATNPEHVGDNAWRSTTSSADAHAQGEVPKFVPPSAFERAARSTLGASVWK